MMKYRMIGLLLLQFILPSLIGQESTSFNPPVQIPILLSGNFGEIRSDHFHSGIDIKTQGTIGHRVSAIDEGFVSRIKVQTNGYGKSIYISHPGGITSVYGHLDRYRDDIAAFVKNRQYKQKSQTVDIYLDHNTFPVKKGEMLAFSGNTGGSSGPHLHFEMRNSANQHPVNVLQYNFEIKDQLPPRFYSIHLYPMDHKSLVNGKDESLSVRILKDNGIYTIPYGTHVEGSGTLGISVEVFDFLNGALNRCGIYSLEMYVDDTLSYGHVMDEFSFGETRYINAHIDYKERIRSGISAHRLHRLPNDRLRIYNRSAANSPLKINENRTYKIRIVASDVAGNRSALEFDLQGKPNPAVPRKPDSTYVNTMQYNRPGNFERGPVRVEIPAYSLYQDIDFTFSVKPGQDGSLGPFYQIGNIEIPVHTSYTLSIASPSVDPGLQSKLLLVFRNKDKDIESAGGSYSDGAVVAKLRNFGEFGIAMDTTAPLIIPVKNSNGNDYSGKKELRFTISDDLSGIEKYEAYIDNQWALFEYDPKNELLSYVFDQERIQSASTHELELYVSDEKGNVNLYHSTFTW